MPSEDIIAILIAERDRLSRAIEVLQGSTERRRPKAGAGPIKTHSEVTTVRKRKLSVGGRKAIADAARRRWAAIRAGKAQSPFAKVKRKK